MTKKKKSKPRSEAATSTVAVGGLKIIDTTTKNSKPKSGGAGPSLASDASTKKKLKVGQESKPRLSAENPLDSLDVKQNVATIEVGETLPEPAENQDLLEPDSATGIENWEDFTENSCNLPSDEKGKTEKPTGKNEQNDGWFDGVTNQNDFANKGAVEKDQQHNNSSGSKSTRRESDNQQQDRRWGNNDHQRSSERQQNRSREREYNSRDTYQHNQKRSGNQEKGSSERGSYSRQKDVDEDYQKKFGEDQEVKGRRGWESNLHWSGNDNHQRSQKEKNQNSSRNSEDWGSSYSSPGSRDSRKNHSQGEGSFRGNYHQEKRSSDSRQKDTDEGYQKKSGKDQEVKGRGVWKGNMHWSGNDNYQGSQEEKNQKPSTNSEGWGSPQQPQGHYQGSRDRNKGSSYSSPDSQDSRKNQSQSEGNFQEQNRNRGRRDMYPSPNRNNEDKEFVEFEKYLKSSREKNYVKVREVEGDLFTVAKEYSLAHCVAEDMAMGSGIAVQFSRDFKRRDELLQQREKQGGLAILEVDQRYIYYLVTKRVSTGKPTMYTLWSSLQKMLHHVEEHKVTQLAMPRIGCGLDRLEWSRVKPMIEYTFRNTDIEIAVYNFQQPEDGSTAAPPRNSKCAVRNVTYPLVQIEPSTAVVYFGSEDGFATEEIQSLDTKFRILQDYKNATKKVGDVIQSIKLQKTYILYGFIVKKSKDDPFNFVNLQKCVNAFKKMNTKDNASYYVGIQAFLDDDDELIMNKIVNIIGYTLYGVDIYVCWPGKMTPFMPQDRRDYY